MKSRLKCWFQRKGFSASEPSAPMESGPSSSHRPRKEEHPGPP